jgi:hypothetical protein
LAINSQKVTRFGDIAVVLTDCNYGVLIKGEATTHHFAVTEVYVNKDDNWKLIVFTFTILIY